MTEEQALTVAFDCINDANGGCPGPYELEAAGIILRMYQERKAAREKEQEPPPALKLEMERDLKGAVAMGKVWGEVFDSLFPPKR